LVRVLVDLSLLKYHTNGVFSVRQNFDGGSRNRDHPRGADKARVFKAALGYDQGNYGDLEKQLRAGVKDQPAIPGDVIKDGVTFSVDVPIEGPTGTGTVRTGWIYREGSDVPRLTTLWVK
jgi:filamentous hemagglutinin